jgi:DNA-binding GntR family transcriptional regulator
MTGQVSGSRRPPTAQEYVLGELRRAITSRELLPGEPVRQDALAERLGVSRVPLREALKILEGEGQIVYAPHRGYFVAELSMSDFEEVYRIRRLLEAEAARVAVPRLSDADLDLLTEAHRQVQAASASSDLAAMAEANRRFHLGLLELSGLPRLVRLIRLQWDATDAYRAVYYRGSRNRERVDHEHRQILDALRARDVDRVVALLDEHRDHAIDELRGVLDSSS